MHALWQDVRYAVRMLWKSPGFTVVAILALGLGIGANSAIFSAVNAFLLQPLSAEKPEQLTTLFETTRERGGFNDFSYPDYVDYRDHNEAFSGLIGYSLVNAAFSTEKQSDLVWGEIVTGNYFDVLGVRAAMGRTFTAEEDRTPGTHPVVIISHHLWQSRFNSDAGIVGRQVPLNGQAFTIIGVAPESFMGTKFALAMDFWAPMMMQTQLMPGAELLNSRGHHWFNVIGRLKDGVTIEQAEANLGAIQRRIAEANGEHIADNSIVAVVPETDGRMGLDDAAVIKLGAGVALVIVFVVLLIACANVANLLLARAATRRREIGIRLALGAGRWRIVRQLLTESVLLAALGGALGLLVAYWTADLLLAFIPTLPYRLSLDFTPDWRVLTWTLAISLLSGIIFGLAPALVASKPDVIPVLKAEAASVIPGAGRKLFNLRGALVVVQIALSVVVLICAGLFIKSLNHAHQINPGFEAENITLMSLNAGLLGYDGDEGTRFHAELLRRVEALPGVESASMASLLHLGDSTSSTGPIIIEGQAPPPPGEGLGILYSTVGAGYFKALGIPLVAGRDFTERDRAASAPVVIINETTARQLFPNENAIGKRFTIADPTRPYREIIGVARDAKYINLGERPRRYMYQPFAQYPTSGMTLIVRTRGAVPGIAQRISDEVQGLDSRVPIFGVKTMSEHLSFALSGPRTAAGLSIAVGLLALSLATLGLFGVMSYAVAQRTREIGIRLALGAQPRDVIKLFTRQGIRLALGGLGVGLAAAFTATHFLSGLLYDVSATDLATFLSVPLLLAAVAFLASYIPARRATKVDPMTALRYE